MCGTQLKPKLGHKVTKTSPWPMLPLGGTTLLIWYDLCADGIYILMAKLSKYFHKINNIFE